MGNQDYGILALSLAVTGSVNLIDFGINNATVKFVASKRNSIRELNRLVQSINLLVFLLAVLSSVFLFSLSRNIVSVMNFNNIEMGTVTLAVRLTAITLFFSFYSLFFESLLIAFDLMKYPKKYKIFINVSKFIIVILIVSFLQQTINVILFTFLIFKILENVVLFYTIRIKTPLQSLLKLSYSKVLTKQLLKFSSNMFIQNLSIMISTVLDKLIVTKFISLRSLAFYEVPTTLGQRLWVIQNSILPAVFPSLVHNVAQRDRLYWFTTRITVNLIIYASSFIVLSSFEILSIWLGSPFANKSYLVLVIITVSMVFNTLSTIISSLANAVNQEKKVTLSTIVFISVFLVVCIFGIKEYGYYAIAYAYVMGFMLQWTILVILVPKPALNYLKELFDILKYPIIIFIISYLVKLEIGFWYAILAFNVLFTLYFFKEYKLLKRNYGFKNE